MKIRIVATKRMLNQLLDDDRILCESSEFVARKEYRNRLEIRLIYKVLKRGVPFKLVYLLSEDTPKHIFIYFSLKSWVLNVYAIVFIVSLSLVLGSLILSEFSIFLIIPLTASIIGGLLGIFSIYSQLHEFEDSWRMKE